MTQKGLVVVTGGAGYLGCVLCELLHEEGYKVRVVDRLFFGQEPIRSLKERGVEIVRHDIRFVPEHVYEGADAVVMLAALSNDPTCELDTEASTSINLHGQLRTATIARKMGVKRLVFASSCSVYGTGKRQALTEDDECDPVSLYSRFKLECEKALISLSEKDFCVTILRFATLYGLAPRMRFDLAPNLMTLSAVRKGKIYVLGRGMQWRPFLHVKDAARAISLVLQAPESSVCKKVFNCGSEEEEFQMLPLASLIANLVRNTDVEVVPDDPDKRSYHVSFARIRKELGFKRRHRLEDAVLEIANALRTNAITDDIKTRTLDYYTYLVQAKKLLDEILLDGILL